MGRMHAPGKGLSQSALPYRRSVPTWLKLTSDDVKEQIYKLAKKGLTPSQIGNNYECVLRFNYKDVHSS
uniref:Small ribosomal subunit protein uS15 N-terminal domain-containing protein n=1 Tax=Colobus angolensis palliatus TaxID=336983 RepID=A0A2K5IBK8_COLAP